jgi:hypothetical protein
VNIDDAALDAAIAKIDGALSKTSQLPTNQTATQNQTDFYTIPDSEMAAVRQREMDEFYTIPNSEMDAFTRKAEQAKKTADNLIKTEGAQIKGLESASGRIMRMIPGLREARRLQVGLENISAGNIVGVVGLLMLALTIYRQISQMQAEQKRQQEAYRQMIMQAQNFTSQTQFQAWQLQTQTALAGYRNRPTIK